MIPVLFLTWKHLKERYRRPSHTIWEILSSSISFVILVTVKNLVVKDPVAKTFMESADAVNLLYTPNNHLSNNLLIDVCNEHEIAPGDKRIHCFGFTNTSEQHSFLDGMRNAANESIVLINFENLNRTSFPEALEYRINFVRGPERRKSKFFDLERIGRMRTDISWLVQYSKQHIKLSKTRMNRTRVLSHAIHQGPVRVPFTLVLDSNASFYGNLQWKIDKTYLEILSGEKINHTLQLKIQWSRLPSVFTEKGFIHIVLVLCSVMAPLPFYLYTTYRILRARTSGRREMLHLVGVSRTQLRHSYLIDTAIFGAVCSFIFTILLETTSHPILSYSNSFIIFFTFVLYYLTLTSFSFLITSITQNSRYSDTLALLVYLLLFQANYLWYHKTQDYDKLFFIMLHAPVFVFWDEVFSLENLGLGAQFDTLFKDPSGHHGIPIGYVWVMFVVQLIICNIIAWYLDLVFPGQYGISVEWNFFAKKKYYKKKKVNFHVSAEPLKTGPRDFRFFEQVPQGTPIVIKIAKASKIYKHYRRKSIDALDEISLDVYKGEITIVVGKHGSGKSTLTQIVSGMLAPTKGTVYIAGMDNQTRLHEIRRDLGYCSKESMLFNYLTVRENVKFFEWLRGYIPTSRATTENILSYLKLQDKSNYYVRQLSASSKKLLQIACALVGDPDVLILDEPTAEMEVDVRYSLWDLLLLLRKEKTVLMTTSMLEEADALADRIVLLSHGKIKCYGSPTFLKNAIGADFHLNLTFNKPYESATIFKLLNESAKEHNIENRASFQENNIYQERGSVTVSLPFNERRWLPEVFKTLETKRKDLGIETMDIGDFMQQVFARFADDDDSNLLYQCEDMIISPEVRLRGCALFCQRLKILMRRALLFSIMQYHQFIVLQIVLPLVCLVICNLISNSDLYTLIHDTEGMADTDTTSDPEAVFISTWRSGQDSYQPLANLYPRTEFLTSDGSMEDYLNFTEHEFRRNAGTYGYELTKNYTDIYVPTFHHVPKAVNIFSNMYSSLRTPNSRKYYINTKYDVIDLQDGLIMPKDLNLCMSWAMWVSFVAHIPMAPMILICTEEYRKGNRFRHILAGCSPTLIWLSKLLVHFLLYCVILPVPTILATAGLDFNHTFNRQQFLTALFLLLLAFGPAFLCHWYAMTFFFRVQIKNPVTVIYIISLCLGLLAPVFIYFADKVFWMLRIIIIASLGFLRLFSPAFTLTSGMCRLALMARNNALCRLNFHQFCPNNMVDSFWMSKEKCCNSKNGVPFHYFSDMHTGGFELTLLILQTLMYWGILMLLQNHIIQDSWEWLLGFVRHFVLRSKIRYGSKNKRVIAEEAYVREKMDQYKKMKLEERMAQPDALLVDNLQKTKSANYTVVKGVSFSVKKGECVCLLGRGLAGKKVTLGLIAGTTPPSGGNCCLKGHFLRKRSKYWHHVQWVTTTGLDDFCTGYENIKTLAMLHGFSTLHSKVLAIRYLRYLGLTMLENNLVSTYSDGYKHRLAISSAFLSSDRVALVDRPLHNADIQSRHLVTRALKMLLSRNDACLISEEDIDWKELEAICSKIVILDHGKMVTVGPVSELRHILATGYTAVIKLNVDQAYHVSTDIDIVGVMRSRSWLPKETVHDLKYDVLETMKTSLLVEEHISQLYFHINDPNREITYSDLFAKLEQLKKKHEIMEDYTITETSVMEILYRIEQQIHGSLEVSRKAKRLLNLSD